MRIGAILLATAGIAGLAACSSNPPKPTVVKLTDSEVEEAVKYKIKTTSGLAGTNIDVDADAEKATMTLSGTVYSQGTRTQVVDLARSVQPSYTITDKIDVKPGDVPLAQYTQDMAQETRESAKGVGDKIGDTVEDAWIHMKIKTKLAANQGLNAAKINVDVQNNVVTLRGNVEALPTKREAGRLASETEGVRRVNNTLSVKPG